MMAITHAAISAAAVGLSLSTVDPLVLAMAIGASQIPDIDTSTSSIGQILWPISRWIEKRYPHRSVTHSLIFTAALGLISFGLWWRYQIDAKVAIALPLGHIVACFSDTFTKAGVQLFWPSPLWCVFGLNPKRRLTTGGTGEYWVLVGAVAAIAINFGLINGGGLSQFTAESLGLRSGILENFQQNANNKEVFAIVEGTFLADSSSASGRYFILSQVGNEFVLLNRLGIYQTGVGAQISATRINTEVGQPSLRQILPLTFAEDEILPKLVSIAQAHPKALILITGQITIDSPEEVSIMPKPGQLETVKVMGNQLVFNHCPLSQILDKLSLQFGSGSLELKIISPSPRL
ncbi:MULTISPECIES: metal-dependent hydrolase [unclassified Microcoleus]|uniref:metal-dependent hydrolase n=1 Tax=unclassified Microcoleus TaxID=2642155 RepID=UPI002FD44187